MTEILMPLYGIMMGHNSQLEIENYCALMSFRTIFGAHPKSSTEVSPENLVDGTLQELVVGLIHVYTFMM